MVKMYRLTLFLTNILLVYGVLCKNAGHRDPRFIRGTYTITEVDTITVTKPIPSTCVQVDPTLPPCRNFRFLYFPRLSQNDNDTKTNDIQSQPETKSEPLKTTELGWGEYLGLYAPTVTLKQTKVVTTLVPDPRILLTYSVKGCRPESFPDDLERCPPESAVAINQILPTSTVTPTATVPASTPKNTRVIEVAEGTSIPVSDINDDPINNNLEPSNEGPVDLGADRQPAATDPLP